MSAERASPAVPALLRFAEHADPRVLVPAFGLTLIGLVSLASTKPELVATQVSGIVVGAAAALALVLLPYRTVMRLAWPAWICAILLLVLVWVPGIGVSAKGASRWIRFGSVQIQPSEFAKAAQVLLLARYVRFRDDHRTAKGLVMPFLLTIVPFLLVAAEPDLGSAMILVPTLFAMLWVAGARTRHLVAVVVMGVVSLPVLYGVLADYQRQRVDAYVHELRESVGLAAPRPATLTREEQIAETIRKRRLRDSKLQTERAEVAVASGGVLGQGWGDGPMNVSNRVPEDWTDFIFVVHAEEWGFAGVTALVAAYLLFFFGLTSLAQETREPAARMLCVGALVSLGAQTCLNLMMTLHLAPVTGVPLPFLTYGRSSMVSAWLLTGLAMHARARAPRVFTR